MNKKNLIISVVVFAMVVALIVGGYFYWRSRKSAQQSAASSVQSAINAAGVITQSATQGILPSIGSATNPLENKPNLNPADKTNPFNSAKTNPFQ